MVEKTRTTFKHYDCCESDDPEASDYNVLVWMGEKCSVYGSFTASEAREWVQNRWNGQGIWQIVAIVDTVEYHDLEEGVNY